MADEPTQQDDHAKAEPAPPVASVPPVAAPPVDTGYTASGVPTFESVREKIETRYGTALGSAELDAETPEGRSAEEQYEARQRAAHDKLEEIRASMHKPDDG
jgi:phage shock protein A